MGKRCRQQVVYCYPQVIQPQPVRVCVPVQTRQVAPVQCNPTPGDTFTPNPVSQNPQISNLKIKDPVASQKHLYNRVISFDVPSGQIPSIIHSGLSPQGYRYSNSNSTFSSSNTASSDDHAVYITKQTVLDPLSGQKRDVYSIGLKKGGKVDLNIAGQDVPFDNPIVSDNNTMAPVTSTTYTQKKSNNGNITNSNNTANINNGNTTNSNNGNTTNSNNGNTTNSNNTVNSNNGNTANSNNIVNSNNGNTTNSNSGNTVNLNKPVINFNFNFNFGSAPGAANTNPPPAVQDPAVQPARKKGKKNRQTLPPVQMDPPIVNDPPRPRRKYQQLPPVQNNAPLGKDPTIIDPSVQVDPPVKVDPPQIDPPIQKNNQTLPPVQFDPPTRIDPPIVNDPPAQIDPPPPTRRKYQSLPPVQIDPPIQVDPPAPRRKYQSLPPVQVDPPAKVDPTIQVDPPVKVDPPQIDPPIQKNNQTLPPVQFDPPTRIDPPIVNDPPVQIDPPAPRRKYQSLSPVQVDPPIKVDPPQIDPPTPRRKYQTLPPIQVDPPIKVDPPQIDPPGVKDPKPINPPIQKKSDIPAVHGDVLPLSRSGEVRYPKGHSVFTNNTQDNLSYSSSPDADVIKSEENAYKCIEDKKNYTDLFHGSPYIRKFSQALKEAKGKKSIEACLAEVTRSGIDGNHKALYRLGDNPSIDDANKNFEVLVITGEPGFEGDDYRWKLDAFMLKHAVTKNYNDRCKNFTILNNPSKGDVEAQIKARAESVKASGRKLYIVYRGHGGNASFWNTEYQKGVAADDKHLQGSHHYKFGLKDTFTEDDYKKLIDKYLKDQEVIHINGSCHSGGSVTATDHNYRKLTLVA